MFSRNHVTVVGGELSSARPGSQTQGGSQVGLWEGQGQGPLLPGMQRSPVHVYPFPRGPSFLIIPSTRVFHSGFSRTYV